jgi:hypothetical protein
MNKPWFIVDVEANGPCPSLGTMTEFGCVYFDHPPFEKRFHGKGPIGPIVMKQFTLWLESITLSRPTFWSDNPAFDWMWMNDAFHVHTHWNPFGYSARRIGDFYAGFRRDPAKSCEWKKFRVTPHDHNPVNDALGNAEALWFILGAMNANGVVEEMREALNQRP